MRRRIEAKAITEINQAREHRQVYYLEERKSQTGFFVAVVPGQKLTCHRQTHEDEQARQTERHPVGDAGLGGPLQPRRFAPPAKESTRKKSSHGHARAGDVAERQKPSTQAV